MIDWLEKKEAINSMIADKMVVFSVATNKMYDESLLFPEEMSLISEKAVLKRKIDFCLGRLAARSALKELGIENFPILKGARNEPVWPYDIVGSISHTNGVALAVAAKKTHLEGIGIDVEMVGSNSPIEIAPKICSEKELEWVSEKENEKKTRMISIFSSKESVFKCLYPEVKSYFDFLDAELFFDEEIKGFRGVLLKDLSEKYYRGFKFVVKVESAGDYIVTFMKL